MRVAAPRLGLLVAVVAVFAGACADLINPVDPELRLLSGVYVLESVDGKPLPLLQLDYSITRQYLLADTLWADGQGHFTETTVTAIDSVERPFRVIQQSTRTAEYTVRDSTVDFPFKCPFGALCIPPPTGWLRADGAFVRAYPSTAGYRLVSRFRHVE